MENRTGEESNEMPGTLVSSMCSPGLGSHAVGIAYMCSLLQSSWISQQSKTAVRRWRRRWWDHNIWHTGVEPSPDSGGSFSTQSSLLSTRSLMVIPLLSAWKSWTGTRILIFYLCIHCTKSLGQKSGQNQQMVHSWVCERYEQLELQPPGEPSLLLKKGQPGGFRTKSHPTPPTLDFWWALLLFWEVLNIMDFSSNTGVRWLAVCMEPSLTQELQSKKM